MTGYGETGPMAPHFSLGPILEAYGGLDDAMGYVAGGPSRLGIAYPDAVGGVHGAYATLAALWQRATTGVAVHVDLSQLETLVSVVGEAVLAASITAESPPRHGNRSVDHAPQGVYRCAGDDRWLALTVTDDERWRRLVDIVGDPELVALRDATLCTRVDAPRRHRRGARAVGPRPGRTRRHGLPCRTPASPRSQRSRRTTSSRTSTCVIAGSW